MDVLEETVKQIFVVFKLHFLTFSILSAYLKVYTAYIPVD